MKKKGVLKYKWQISIMTLIFFCVSLVPFPNGFTDVLAETILKSPVINSDGTVFISPIKRSGIKTYEIPKGVKEIANFAFHAQREMTSVIIPNTVEKIGASFNYCTALTSIEIPSSVKEINTSCFANSTNLREIRIHQKNDGTLTGSPWGCIYGDKAIIWDD